MPAQAGIQGLRFQEWIGKGGYPTVRVSACAGMTIWAFLFEFTVFDAIIGQTARRTLKENPA